VEILPLGTNTEYFRPVSKKQGAEKRILVSGANRRDNEVTMALISHFAAHHPDVVFEIVGNRPIQDFADAMPNAIAHRYLDDDAMMEVYARCEIGILPLVHAASSNSLNEYISCALPFVYSRFSGMSELDLEHFGIPVPPGDAQAFIASVERLFFDDDLIERLKANCMEEREKLSWTPKVCKFWEMVESL
jgi:glycosyltransferase involved in cell wall biosynthesis